MNSNNPPGFMERINSELSIIKKQVVEQLQKMMMNPEVIQFSLLERQAELAVLVELKKVADKHGFELAREYATKQALRLQLTNSTDLTDRLTGQAWARTMLYGNILSTKVD